MRIKFLITVLAILTCSVNFAQAPVNDDCDNAIVISLGVNSCISSINGTTENATQSSQPAASCDNTGGGYNDDVWFTFTATQSGIVNFQFSNITGGGQFDYLSAALYSGPNCNTLTEISCSYYAENLPTQHVTQGTTYYLRLYSYSNDPAIYKSFTLCTYLTSNDECVSAKELTVGSLSAPSLGETLGTTDGATESSTIPLPSCGGTGYNDDVWYKFTALSSGNTFVRLYGFGSISYQVYAGTCAGLTPLDCGTGSVYSYSYNNINAVSGTEYYIRVFSTDPDPLVTFDFSIAVYSLTPTPANDDCNNAVEMTLGDGSCQQQFYGSTLGATQSSNSPSPSCDATGTDDDIWFKFASTDTRPLRIELQNSYYYGNNSGITVQIYTGSCNGLVLVSCNSFTGYNFGDNFAFQINAVAATDYYLRVFTPENEPVKYAGVYVCAYYLPPPPANDECAGAILIQAAATTQCTAPTNGTTIGSNGSSIPACYGSSNIDDDVWYKFTATANSLIINVSPAVVGGLQEYTAYQVFSGDCNTLTELNCVVSGSPTGAAQQAIPNLIIGDTYYVRVYSLFNVYSYKGDFSICITTLNDECNAAETLTVNPTPDCTVVTNGSTIHATQSNIYYSCSGNNDDDVWYKFTATSSSHKIKVTPTLVNGIDNVVVQIFEGDCSSLNQTYCVDNTIGQDAEEISAGSLVPGNIYYLRLHSYNAFSGNGDFTVCISTTNDDCANATAVPVNPDASCTQVITGSTIGATQSALGACAGFNDDDVWYSFVATNATHKITITPTVVYGIDNAVLEFFYGDCNSLSTSPDFCVDNTIGSDVEEKILTYLLPGTTYYFRVYSSYNGFGSGDFSICVSSYNNDCNSAVIVPVNSDENCTTVLHGSTVHILSTDPGCVGDADDAMWYKFTATATNHKIIVTPSLSNGLSNAVMEIFSGYCSFTNLLYCVDNTSGSDPEQVITYGLNIGQDYYVKVYSYLGGSGQGEFDLCVSTITAAPVNDECYAAIPLTVSSTPDCTSPVTGTTFFATASSAPSCNANYPDDDVWYSFVAMGTSQLITITSPYLNGIVDPAIQFYSGNCNSLTNMGCISCPGCGGFLYTLQTIPGNTYYMSVYSQANGTGQGDFSICVSSYAPLNDDCLGAIDVAVNNDNTCTLTTNGTTVHATSSGQYGACLNGTADDDVWYKFTATAPAHQISITPSVTGGIDNVIVEVYAGTCGVSLSYIACANNTTGNAAETALAEGLNIGQTYYFRVYSAANYSGQGTFSICINGTVVNDDCSGAITIPVNNDATCTNTYDGTTVGSSNTQLQVPNCSYYHDVWYKFVAESTACNINVTPAAVGGINGVTWGLFSGDCNNLVRLGCTSNTATFENLIIGNTYYLQVSNQQSNPAFQGAFTICVRSINATVPNDICNGAVDVPISNEITCVTTVTGSTTGAGISLSTGLKDVWYKFTATETAHKIKVSPVADSLKNVAFEVYSGNCGSLASIVQVNNFFDPGYSYNNFDTTKPETQSVENFTIGNTYYIRVFSGGVYRNNSLVDPDGSFNICVSLSANDVCSFAKTIPVNAGPDCNNITIDSTDYSTPPLNLNYSNNCGILNPVKDSWFKFIALDTAQMITVSSQGWQLFAGSCGTLNSVACFPNSPREIVGGLSIGEIYYLRVYSGIATATAKFSICISATAINNECARAFSLPVNTAPGCALITNGSTRGSTPSSPYPYNCNNSFNTTVGNDVWYKFVATATQHKVTVAGSTEGINLFFTIYSGDCNSLNSIVCTNDYTPLNSSTDEEVVALDNLIVGNTYYVRVYNQLGRYTVGDFTICVGPVDPLNDLCSNAIEVPVNNSPACNLSVTGNNIGATRSYDSPVLNNSQYDPCTHIANADVFYTFIANTTSHLVTITPTVIGGINDVMFQVYTGSCGSFSPFAYIDETIGVNEERNTLFNLIPGNNYYIRVSNADGQHSGRGSFTICITSPLQVNDDPCDAIALTVNNTSACAIQLNGSTVGATPLNGLQDVWYKFVAAAPEQEITVTAGTMVNPAFSLYKGDCSGYTAIREEINYDALGTGVEFQSYDSLIVGATYLVRVRASLPAYPACRKDASFNTTGTFSICVAAPLIPNDLIDLAVTVPVNAGTTCTNIITGTNYGSTYSANEQDCLATNVYGPQQVSDVWYKFIATSRSHFISVTASSTGGISYFGFAVYERISPGAEGLQQRGCINQNPFNIEAQSFPGLIPGREYYIRVMSPFYSAYLGGFTLCVTTPALPTDNSNIITFAGGGTGVGVSADNSKLYSPTDVTVDNVGNVYFADNGFIKKINKADGVMSIVAGTGIPGFSGDGGLATAANIALGIKIAVDNSGNIFIGDYDGAGVNNGTAGLVRKINTSGIISTVVTLPGGDFWDGNCCPPLGGICGCSRSNYRKITGITTDAAGNVFFTANRDETHCNLSGCTTWKFYDFYKLTPSGNLTIIQPGSGFSYGLTIDAQGNLYTKDLTDLYYIPTIKKTDVNGAFPPVSRIAGPTSTPDYSFGYTGDGGSALLAAIKPTDVKADAAGNIYMADGNGYWNGKEYGNYSIRKITPAGIISTIAGIGLNDYSGDHGPATLASMHTPASIALDSSGNIYVVDIKDNESPLTATNRIRKIIKNCSGGIAMSSMGNTFYVNADKVIYKDCDTIAKVAAVSPALFNKDITAKVWIEPTVPSYNNIPYVARHYEITPLTDPSSTTTRITLYFTQQEFTDYNTAIGAGNLLPVDGVDANNYKVNLRIVQLSGNSIDGSGLQGTYTSQSSVIDPDDNDIIWNDEQNRWEISFESSGANGFFIQTPPATITLNLKLFLEGFYTDINTMRANIYDLGISTDPAETDTVIVNLWAATNLLNAAPDYSVPAVLYTDGTATMQYPSSVTGNEFYIAVKHRNHMETWSKLPVTFTSTTSYDFSNALAQAYDDGINPPMASVAGNKFAFYGGDVNQDGTVDGSDANDIEIGANNFDFGYNAADANGDGETGGQDANIVEVNANLFLFYSRPF